MSWLDVPRIYALHVLALFQPGRGAPVHEADTNVAGDISGWSNDQVKTLIDEGRRQIDRQNEDLERVRGRAQVTLTLGLALAGAAGSLRAAVSSVDAVGLWVLWILGLAFVSYATLGAAATAVVRADMKMIHGAVLSRYEGDIDRQLARDYANIAATGEKQIATRLTNLWLAVALLLTGAVLTLGAWLWADAAHSGHQQTHPPPVHAQNHPPKDVDAPPKDLDWPPKDPDTTTPSFQHDLPDTR
jgi:hypothetical protein